MKKITLFAALFMIASGIIAQDVKYKIGFKVNPNVSWLKPQDNNITSDGSKLAFGFALNFDKMFTDNYAIGTGLNIFNTGGKLSYYKTAYSTDTTMTMVSRNYKLQYAEIPLTLKLRTNEIGYFTFWGQFGLGLGVNISSKANETISTRYKYDSRTEQWSDAKGANGLYLETSETDANVKDDIALFRTSLIMGLGGEYNLSGSTSILFGLTFNNGFSDVLRDSAVKKAANGASGFLLDANKKPSTFKLNARSNLIELNIGILF